MNYRQIEEGIFLERPNRFIAYVEVDGRTETVHVKNTGRCRELLQPGVTVYLERTEALKRKTAYDLVAVQKGDKLINMDSQAPNKAVEEWLRAGGLFDGEVKVFPETVYGKSRFDFYVEAGEERIFIEVKGVTLEEDGILQFPDAPSERAVKHVGELIQARKEGYQAYILFVLQMREARLFTPNRKTHPEFAEALERAVAEGVKLLAYNCLVTPDSMILDQRIPICMNLEKNFGIGEIKEIPNPLLLWYDKHRRILPWREEPTPYRVWVSEIMLQQTRVEAVKPYFERFMNALPDIEALAKAPEEELLKLWEGLGYYNRVRNLQKAAIQIMEEHGGQMPGDYEALLKLKGIGSYTAGAVASIAFRIPVPAVDGNVLRVLSRVRADDRLITDAKVKTAVETELVAVVPVNRPGDFNQAMMELGACVCIPNGAPHCEECPLQHFCRAHLQGEELAFPRKAAKKERAIEQKTILILRDENTAAIKKRAEKGLLAGMYEFPAMDGFCTPEEVTVYLAENGIQALRIRKLEDAKHIFTHKEWHMTGYMIRVDELAPRVLTEITRDWIYVEPGQVQERYPMPAAFAAYTRYLDIKLGNERYEEQERS